MFSSLLSRACTEPRSFLPFTSASGDAQGVGGGHTSQVVVNNYSCLYHLPFLGFISLLFSFLFTNDDDDYYIFQSLIFFTLFVNHNMVDN